MCSMCSYAYLGPLGSLGSWGSFFSLSYSGSLGSLGYLGPLGSWGSLCSLDYLGSMFSLGSLCSCSHFAALTIPLLFWDPGAGVASEARDPSGAFLVTGSLHSEPPPFLPWRDREKTKETQNGKLQININSGKQSMNKHPAFGTIPWNLQ